MTWDEWKDDALKSADEDGKVGFLPLTNWFHERSAILGMMMDGLIEHRCRHDDAGPWYITDKGRARSRAKVG